MKKNKFNFYIFIIIFLMFYFILSSSLFSIACEAGEKDERGYPCVPNRPTMGEPTVTWPDGTKEKLDLGDSGSSSTPSNPCSSGANYYDGSCYRCSEGTYFSGGSCHYTTSGCESNGGLWCSGGCFSGSYSDGACGSDGQAYTCQKSSEGFSYDPSSNSCRRTLSNGTTLYSEAYSGVSGSSSNPSVNLVFTSDVTQSVCSQTFCSGNNKFPYHTHTIDPRKFNSLCTSSSMTLTALNGERCGSYECGGCIFAWGQAQKRCADHNHDMCGLTVDYYSNTCDGDVSGCGGDTAMRDHKHSVTGVFEADTSEACCQGCGKTWMNDMCCGDDSSEIGFYRKVAENSNLGIISNTEDKSCCSSVNSCVFEKNCYSPQTSPIDLDKDGDLDYCNANGEWQDMPNTCDGTSNFCLCNIGKLGLCELSGSDYFCYCDFQGVYSRDSDKPIVSFLRPPTPESTFDEYVQKQESKIEISIREPSLTSFELYFTDKESEETLGFIYPFLYRIYSSGFEGESDLGSYYTLDASFSEDGRYGKALSFDGTNTLTLNNFYNLSHEFPLLLGSKKENNFNGAASYFAWIKPTKLDSTDKNIFCDNNCNEGYIRMYNNKIVADFGFGNIITYEKSFEENQWYHIAMTHNYNSVNGLYELKLYLNGELIGTSTSSSTSADYGPDDQLIIGKNFVGLIDEVQIFNTVLPQYLINFIYATSIEREGPITKFSFDLSSFNMTEVVESYWYYVIARDFSDNMIVSDIESIKLFDVENNHGNFEIKDSKIEVSDKDIKIQYLVKNIGDNDFFPSIFLPPELDDFYVQKQLDYIGEGKELWINLTLSTKYSNLGEFSKGYDVYNYTEYYSDGSLIKLYKLRDYNTALFRDTLNKKDLILNYDFDVEISSGDRNKTQDISFDVNYFCSGERFIIDLVKDNNVYYCLCEDKGFCLNDRPCACIVYPERFVDSSLSNKVYFNALYSFDPRTYDEKGEELYYKWYMVGLQEEPTVNTLNINEGLSQDGAEFELTLRQEGDYYTSVSVSSNEKEDTDFVNFLFSPKDLPYCQRDGSKWIIGGEEIQLINSLDNCYMENGYNKKVCCPAGYKCDGGSCVASLDYSDCGDYITKETCEADDYNVGLKSVEEINGEYFCSSIQFLDDGNQIYVHDCKCSWDEEQGNCGTKYNQTGYNSGGTINYQITGSCEMKVSNIIGDCDTDDFKVYNMKAVWESESPESEIPSYCKDQTKKIECGNLVLLNFFDTTQVILTILIIVLVYLIIFRIKKKN